MCLELRLSSFIQRMVSCVQELQRPPDQDHCHVIAIDAISLDDAQTNVKHMFNDVAFREKLATNKLQFHLPTL